MQILPVFVTVIAVKPAFRTDPDVSFRIFNETGYPMTGRLVRDLNTVLVNVTDLRSRTGTQQAKNRNVEIFGRVFHGIKVN
jgi:hypothetical protein